VSDLVKTTARTPLALLALVLVAALVGASCSSVTPQALSVDGVSLSERDFLAVMDALTDDEESTYSTALSAGVLNVMVQLEFARQEADRRDLEVQEVDRRNAEVQLSFQFSPSPGQFDGTNADPAGQAVLDDLPSGVRERLVDGYASLVVVGGDVLDRAASDEGLRELFEAQGDAGERACASHILVQAGTGAAEPTEEEFDAALAEIEEVEGQLDGTANFAALAAEFSDDPGSAAAGGELGCAPEGTYVEEFDEVVWTQPLDTVSEPVRTSFGYHLILVTARGEVTFEDVEAQLARSVQREGEAIVSSWLQNALGEAEVSVDPKWGRWVPETAQVRPPAGAQVPAGGELDLDLEQLLNDATAAQG
jgi:parvulin-like peptidyl-prolyl isomerase